MLLGGITMNCERISKEMMEYAINSMTLEEHKHFRNAMMDAEGDIDAEILIEDKDWREHINCMGGVMMSNSWEKDGVNYWENEDCRRVYLEEAFIELVYWVEGEDIDEEYAKSLSETKLREDVGFYEYVADK